MDYHKVNYNYQPDSSQESKWEKVKSYLKNKKVRLAIAISLLVILIGGGLLFVLISDKKELAVKSLNVLQKASAFLPIESDYKQELEVINKLVQAFTEEDNKTRRFLVLLQNNFELRPTGGFLGQYAILEIKNGEVESLFVEDANLLDQRITAKVKAPYPFKRLMSIKNWKFRDSNFSPDFPTSADKVKYFYQLSGRNNNFDGVIAVNAEVLNNVLELTGPIEVSGIQGSFTSENAAIKLEDLVEKPYLMNPDLDTQNRKWILKEMAPIIMDKLMSLNNIPKLAQFVHQEMANKNIMLNFAEANLQQAVEDVFWAGKVSENWNGDYLMVVDANMGALKTDYYMKRKISYDVDLTQEQPIATVQVTYNHTATHGDWRTSDYHSYLRLFVPEDSELLERKMVSYPFEHQDLGKTVFGFILHALIGRETVATVTYKLPHHVKNNYKLLVQKQSGVGDVPIKIHVKSDKGDFNKEEVLKKDLKFEIRE